MPTGFQAHADRVIAPPRIKFASTESPACKSANVLYRIGVSHRFVSQLDQDVAQEYGGLFRGLPGSTWTTSNPSWPLDSSDFVKIPAAAQFAWPAQVGSWIPPFSSSSAETRCTVARAP